MVRMRTFAYVVQSQFPNMSKIKLDIPKNHHSFILITSVLLNSSTSLKVLGTRKRRNPYSFHQNSHVSAIG